MPEKYALVIKDCIDRYNNDVIPLIEQHEYKAAALGLDDSIINIDHVKDQIPDGMMLAYTNGLEQRLRVLQRSLKEGKMIDNALDHVEERIHVVDLYMQGQIDKK